MRYASIRNLDISNGANIGVALFVQGCDRNPHCKNCFHIIVKDVLMLKHGILMVGKSGQKKQKINLWNSLIDRILSEFPY